MAISRRWSSNYAKSRTGHFAKISPNEFEILDLLQHLPPTQTLRSYTGGALKKIIQPCLRTSISSVGPNAMVEGKLCPQQSHVWRGV